jgi:hypothetical protein
LEAYLGGILELAEFERKRKELEGRTDALLAQERQLEASARERTELARIADSIEGFCEQVRAGLAEATFEQRRRLVELLIDRVIVSDEEVEIRYVVPTSPEGPHQPFAICVQTIERTFAWLGQNRRMSKDYERLPQSAEAFIYVAMSRLMVRRLARG